MKGAMSNMPGAYILSILVVRVTGYPGIRVTGITGVMRISAARFQAGLAVVRQKCQA
jgi:hypothetical protein